MDPTSPARAISASRFIAAPADQIFAILDNPAMHPRIDGSGTVRRSRLADTHLKLGDRFGMDMRIGLPYRVRNTVVEYEKDRRIAWAHLGGHRWRFELQPVEGGTEVTETFDWSTSKAPKLIELAGYPRRHQPHLAQTLERLAAQVSSPT